MTYSIELKERPPADHNYVVFDLKKSKPQHSIECGQHTSTQIRGNKRKEIAKACILNGGSAKAESLAIKADDSVLQKPSTRVIQNCKQEYKKKDLISNDWMINLHHQAMGLSQGKYKIFFYQWHLAV